MKGSEFLRRAALLPGKQPAPWYHVTGDTGRVRGEKIGQASTLPEARALAREASLTGAYRAVRLFVSVRGGYVSPGDQPLAVWRNGAELDEETLYALLQAVDAPLPPPSPADDLGEEEF